MISSAEHIIDAYIVCWQQRANLQTSLANLRADYDALQARFDEEAEDAANAKARYAKLDGEYQALRNRYDRDMAAKNDELEELRWVWRSNRSNWVCLSAVLHNLHKVVKLSQP